MNAMKLACEIDQAPGDHLAPVWFVDDEGVRHAISSVTVDDDNRILLVGETG